MLWRQHFSGGAMALWMAWWAAINLLRPAFSRLRSFMWFVTVVAGLSVRTEHLGVTSIVRAMKLRPALYNRLLKSFHSKAIDIDRLSQAVGQRGDETVPRPGSREWPACAGRRRHQGGEVRQEDAGREAAAPGIRQQHQARIHNGTFPAGSRHARAGSQFRFLGAAGHAHP